MTTSGAYKDLNLREGAGEMEIRAAFRRLAKDNHPDTGSGGDVAKFRKGCAAYKTLMRLARSQRPGTAPSGSGAPFVFDGQRKAGLDVYYDIAVLRPGLGQSLTLTLPAEGFEACPRCLGQGRTLSRASSGSDLYRPQSCPKCSGRGAIATPKTLSVTATPEMLERGRFRLRGAGGYLPKEARRGDLIVRLRWVDRLPTGH